jgi:vancomycin permeability regulator SanA
MVKADRISSTARGIALFIGTFALLNVLAAMRHGPFDGNQWWIDFRPLPTGAGRPATALLAVALATWAVRPRMAPWRTALTVSLLVMAIAVAIYNAATFYRLKATGVIATPVPAPFSVLVAVVLAAILWQATRRSAKLSLGCGATGFIACAVGFPLAQTIAFGLTDYRRPADAILVFGARAYANGQPSDALEDRVLTAIELYKQGLAPRLIFSGGPGDGAWSEAAVMRKIAENRGVPESATTLDDAGLTTDASVRNAARLLATTTNPRLLAVSHAWHLPRVKLRCEREGLIAYTVPADERGQPLRKTPYLVAREVPAIWLYYLRALAGS